IAVESLAMLAWSIVLPSMLSIAAEMVPAARLGDALSLQKSSQSAGNLIGPVLGGGLMAATSPTLTLLAYAFLLVVAAAASLYVRVPPRATGAVRSPWLDDIRSGLYARWRIPLERYWTLAVFITLVAFMPLVTTLLPVKLHALGLSAAWLGGCEAAISAGMLLGSLWFTHVLLRRFSRYQARTIGMLVCGVLMLVVAVSDNPWLILAC
ncbi:MFS transporter, partial [Pseudomonas sp. MWU13-2860]